MVRPTPRHVRFEDIVCRSAAMQALLAAARRLCSYEVRVLITGETGTGKELLARAIHDNGPRHAGAFVAVNCGAVPRDLAESLFFGHLRGSFTGAISNRRGWFTLAHRGTIFLDEVTSLPPDLQVKLLRALQDDFVCPVGSERPVPFNARVIAATNRDIREEVAAGRFRDDLFYRLNVVPVHVPPLRSRTDDISTLLYRFLDKFTRRFQKPVTAYSEDAERLLGQYPWPGNVRELEHVVERLVIQAEDTVIRGEHLPPEFHSRAGSSSKTGLPPGSLKKARLEFERQFILTTLSELGWNQTQVARRLGINRKTLISKMHALGLHRRVPVPEA